VIDPELRDIKVSWVSLPGAMVGMRHLHISQTHGNNTVTELWLTQKQVELVAKTISEFKLVTKGD
jgi:hypothetical protein